VLIGERLVALGSDGASTQLVMPVVDVLTRPDGFPLIITRTNSAYTILDTHTWMEQPLDLPLGSTLNPGALLSPDDTQFAVHHVFV
jgi:hypothetical protein